MTSLALNQFQDCEDFLVKRVDLVQDLMTEEHAIYSCYNDLFSFYLRSNLEKAILLGKALESEEEQKSIPVYLQKLFLMNTGVGKCDQDCSLADWQLPQSQDLLQRVP